MRRTQYGYIIAAVVGSAVIPTLIANAFFLPRHLLPRDEADSELAQARVPPASDVPDTVIAVR
ncbi:MAG: hypothetical protein P4L92_01425 [Rudaea sp.]|nr:hypothetical protein [Rudaea sp.]